MHRHRRKQKQTRRILFLSLVIFLLTMTVGYATFNTNLNITAKGNIVDNTIDITEAVVTDGDGLYKDEYEEGRYVYKGSNPDNYISIGEHSSNGDIVLWRIISKEADGTYKIIRDELLPAMPFDRMGIRTSGYCSNNPNGCNAWAAMSDFTNGVYSGVVDKDAEINYYLNAEYYKQLEENVKENIVLHNWSIGAITNADDLSSQIINENKTIWSGNIGLISASDYLRANNNMELCGSIQLNNSNFDNCSDSNWLYNNNNYWLISPYGLQTTDWVYIIYPSGQVDVRSSNDNDVLIRPSLYLNSDISLQGKGSKNNPFTIK